VARVRSSWPSQTGSLVGPRGGVGPRVQVLVAGFQTAVAPSRIFPWTPGMVPFWLIAISWVPVQTMFGSALSIGPGEIECLCRVRGLTRVPWRPRMGNRSWGEQESAVGRDCLVDVLVLGPAITEVVPVAGSIEAKHVNARGAGDAARAAGAP
jgi:hypothetical protein